MHMNAWQIIGVALIAVGLVGGAAGLSISGEPYFSLSVYTNVAEGTDNVLRITLLNVEDPAGQAVVVQFDGGFAQTVELDSLGKATVGFKSGSPGYHFITCHWSGGTESAEATVGYIVVVGTPDPDPIPDEPVVPIIPISSTVAAVGGVVALIGTFGVKRLE